MAPGKMFKNKSKVLNGIICSLLLFSVAFKKTKT